MAVPQDWLNLGFTSGRRTYKGNRLVGGVPNSDHLEGHAGDFTASEAALRARFGPGVHILNEGDHRHVSGLADVPYYGNQGIAGLVGGVDTSAPRRAPVPQAKPRTLANLQQQPLPPQPGTTLADLQTAPLGVGSQGPVMPQDAPPEMAQQNMPQLHKHASLGEIIAAGLNGYVAASGNPIGLENMRMMDEAQQRAERGQLEREHWSAQLEAQKQERMAKLQEPPAQIQLANYVMGLPEAQRSQVLAGLDAVNPVTTSGPTGTFIVPRSVHGASGPTTKQIGNATYYLVNGEWYDNPEGR